ncbi:VOC family protein [Pseudoduganella lurida]|uniref:VOC family protein n=1 Tax=Pseudoduganella lurida TaxID=1036180 RepID=UPI0011A5AFC8|nr:VOC family protein [Pseudoduganella lurida]
MRGGTVVESVPYLSGCARIIVYPAGFAGTNQATGITRGVGDERAGIVAALESKGVVFEHHRIEGLRLTGDVHAGDGIKLAGFRNLDGNILNIFGI